MAKIKKGDRITSLHECDKHGSTAYIDGEEVSGITNGFKEIKEGQPVPSHGQLVWTDQAGTVTDTLDLGIKKGPARVNSKQYRDGYERVFGKEAN